MSTWNNRARTVVVISAPWRQRTVVSALVMRKSPSASDEELPRTESVCPPAGTSITTGMPSWLDCITAARRVQGPVGEPLVQRPSVRS